VAALVEARFPRVLAWPLTAVSAVGGLLSLWRSLRPVPSRSDEPADESADVPSDLGLAPFHRRDPGG
jgi:hypothetical protein